MTAAYLTDKERGDVNPKEEAGLKKIPYSYVPAGVQAMLALAMYEGKKYGRHNYRVMGNIKSSIYYDAAKRHLEAWWEGEDIDPESGLPHWVKLMACMAVLGDSTMTGRLEDDRPPKLPEGWMKALNDKVEEINRKITKFVEPYTEKNKDIRKDTVFQGKVDGN